MIIRTKEIKNCILNISINLWLVMKWLQCNSFIDFDIEYDLCLLTLRFLYLKKKKMLKSKTNKREKKCSPLSYRIEWTVTVHVSSIFSSISIKTTIFLLQFSILVSSWREMYGLNVVRCISWNLIQWIFPFDFTTRFFCSLGENKIQTVKKSVYSLKNSSRQNLFIDIRLSHLEWVVLRCLIDNLKKSRKFNLIIM